MDEKAILQVLSNVASSDHAVRSNAEQQLKEMAKNPVYPVYLAQLVVAQAIDVPHRQLAALSLKNYVTTQWTAKSDEFEGLEPLAESKKHVRETIIHGLSDPAPRIRVICAYVVSKIAQDDFPEDWPELWGILLGYLKSNQADSVHGAMRVLSEMVGNDLNIQQLPQIGSVLVPELYRILTSDTIYSFRTRGRAVNILESCVDMTRALREENPGVADQFIGPMMPQWIDAFRTVLSHHVQNDPEKATEEYGLKMEVVKCIKAISDEYPKLIKDNLSMLFELVWENVNSLRERYVQEMVHDDGDIAESFQDSDGNNIGFQSLLYALLEFITVSCTKKTVRHLFEVNGKHTPFFVQLVYIFIIFIQITKEREELWLSDANQFVTDEDGETTEMDARLATEMNARLAATDALITLQEVYPVTFFNALWEAVQHHVKESNELCAAGRTEWWKIQEACLLSVIQVSDDLLTLLQDTSKQISFSIESLFEHVVPQCIQADDYPFLRGRAIVFASVFAKCLPAKLADQYLGASVNSLQSRQGGIPVTISSLRAVNNYSKFLEPEQLAPYQTTIMEGIFQLLPMATEESLTLLLETLTSAIKINREVSARFENILTPAMLDIWKNFHSDMIINSYILDIFEEFSKNTYYFTGLYNRTLPFLSQVFKSGQVDASAISSAIDILTSMISCGPSPLPEDFTHKIFQDLMTVALDARDDDLLQSSQECLKKLIAKDCDRVIQWHDGSGKSGLDYVIHFVAKLLEPERSELEALFVGGLMVILIRKAGNTIAPVLPDLLRAVLIRVESTSNQWFIQSLVLIFAHLIVNQQDTVIQFLSETNIHGKNGLEILMPVWCDNHDSFSGHYSIKVSTVALSKIFLSGDPRLQNIDVKGDIVVDPNAGIVTRSRSKRNPDKYSLIKLPAKIIKLLVADAINSVSNDVMRADDVESVNEEDGDWEDVDEYSSMLSSRQEMTYLSDVLANLTDDVDEEENDEDLKEDPIFQMDIKAYLMDTLRNWSAHNVNHFMDICMQYLNDDERQQLDILLKGGQ